MALFMPRRLARFTAQAFSQDHFWTRVGSTVAASNRRPRIIASPHREMRLCATIWMRPRITLLKSDDSRLIEGITMARLYDSRKRIIVTGGAGFLGSHLMDRLISRGHEVICIDNFFTGTKKNIEHLKDKWNFEFIRHDVTLPMSYEADEIYNLACPASPTHYQHDPIQTTRTSVLGALNILDLATRLKCRVLQASTSEIYGDPEIHPQVETYWGNVNPIGPRSCYDEGKRCAETLFFDYRRQYGLRVKVARIFNTYGTRMHPADGRVVSNFVLQALRGDPITIFGQGSQTRSFCYVDDLVEGLIRLMESDEGVTGPINLGNPDEFTIRELAEMVIEQVGSSSKIVFEPLPQDDPRQRQPDISQAKALLGWEPKVKLRDGLARTIEFFRESILPGYAPS